MLRVALQLLVRSLVELALILLAVAALAAFMAYRLARRFLTPSADPLEQLAGKLGGLLPIASSLERRFRSREAAEVVDPVLAYAAHQPPPPPDQCAAWDAWGAEFVCSVCGQPSCDHLAEAVTRDEFLLALDQQRREAAEATPPD